MSQYKYLKACFRNKKDSLGLSKLPKEELVRRINFLINDLNPFFNQSQYPVSYEGEIEQLNAFSKRELIAETVRNRRATEHLIGLCSQISFKNLERQDKDNKNYIG